jgi:hypothetical protein
MSHDNRLIAHLTEEAAKRRIARAVEIRESLHWTPRELNGWGAGTHLGLAVITPLAHGYRCGFVGGKRWTVASLDQAKEQIAQWLEQHDPPPG